MSVRVSCKSESENATAFDNDFIQLSVRLESSQPAFVGLDVGLQGAFLNFPVPVAREYLLATVDGLSVARCCLSQSWHRKEICYMGMIASDENHAQISPVWGELMKKAQGWARERGCQTIIGPVNFSTWFSYRFRIDTFDASRFYWEPNQPEEYCKIFTENGFAEDQAYFSVALADGFQIHLSLKANYDAVMQRGFRFRAVSENRFDEDMKTIHALTLESFAREYLFDPIGLSEFNRLYLALVKRPETPAITRIVEDANGQACGYFFCLVEKDDLVCKSIGLSQPCLGQGMSYAFFYESIVYYQRQYGKFPEKIIMALVKYGSTSEKMVKRIAMGREEVWRHTYMIWKKDLL